MIVYNVHILYVIIQVDKETKFINIVTAFNKVNMRIYYIKSSVPNRLTFDERILTVFFFLFHPLLYNNIFAA